MSRRSADALVQAARAAALHAHAPYSGFHVGCAVESDDGQVAVGANMENACYRLGVCAEQAALAAAAQAFGLARVVRLAVVGGRITNGALMGETPVTPCGGCRQAIAEVAHAAKQDTGIICASGDGTAVRETTLRALLPDAFGPASL